MGIRAEVYYRHAQRIGFNLKEIRLTMGRTKNFSEDIEKKAIYNYVVNKQGLGTAGKEFGISQYMMEKILKKYQIPKRTYTEAKQKGDQKEMNSLVSRIQRLGVNLPINNIVAFKGDLKVNKNVNYY